MKRRYEVVLFMPCRGGWSKQYAKRFRSLPCAERFAKRLADARPVPVTRNGPCVTAPYTEVHDNTIPYRECVCYSDERCTCNSSTSLLTSFDAPQRIVPSVGDVGYW